MLFFPSSLFEDGLCQCQVCLTARDGHLGQFHADPFELMATVGAVATTLTPDLLHFPCASVSWKPRFLGQTSNRAQTPMTLQV